MKEIKYEILRKEAVSTNGKKNLFWMPNNLSMSKNGQVKRKN